MASKRNKKVAMNGDNDGKQASSQQQKRPNMMGLLSGMSGGNPLRTLLDGLKNAGSGHHGNNKAAMQSSKPQSSEAQPQFLFANISSRPQPVPQLQHQPQPQLVLQPQLELQHQPQPQPVPQLQPQPQPQLIELQPLHQPQPQLIELQPRPQPQLIELQPRPQPQLIELQPRPQPQPQLQSQPESKPHPQLLVPNMAIGNSHQIFNLQPPGSHPNENLTIHSHSLPTLTRMLASNCYNQPGSQPALPVSMVIVSNGASQPPLQNLLPSHQWPAMPSQSPNGLVLLSSNTGIAGCDQANNTVSDQQSQVLQYQKSPVVQSSQQTILSTPQEPPLDIPPPPTLFCSLPPETESNIHTAALQPDVSSVRPSQSQTFPTPVAAPTSNWPPPARTSPDHPIRHHLPTPNNPSSSNCPLGENIEQRDKINFIMSRMKQMMHIGKSGRNTVAQTMIKNRKGIGSSASGEESVLPEEVIQIDDDDEDCVVTSVDLTKKIFTLQKRLHDSVVDLVDDQDVIKGRIKKEPGSVADDVLPVIVETGSPGCADIECDNAEIDDSSTENNVPSDDQKSVALGCQDQTVSIVALGCQDQTVSMPTVKESAPVPGPSKDRVPDRSVNPGCADQVNATGGVGTIQTPANIGQIMSALGNILHSIKSKDEACSPSGHLASVQPVPEVLKSESLSRDDPKMLDHEVGESDYELEDCGQDDMSDYENGGKDHVVVNDGEEAGPDLIKDGKNEEKGRVEDMNKTSESGNTGVGRGSDNFCALPEEKKVSNSKKKVSPTSIKSGVEVTIDKVVLDEQKISPPKRGKKVSPSSIRSGVEVTIDKVVLDEPKISLPKRGKKRGPPKRAPKGAKRNKKGSVPKDLMKRTESSGKTCKSLGASNSKKTDESNVKGSELQSRVEKSIETEKVITIVRNKDGSQQKKELGKESECLDPPSRKSSNDFSHDESSESDSSSSDEDDSSSSSSLSDSSEEDADVEYRCKLCSKSFHKKSHFKKHMKKHYKGDEKKPERKISCKACRRKFSDITALQAHLLQRRYCFFDCTRAYWRKKASSAKACRMCGKGVTKWKDLKKHSYRDLTCRLRFINIVLENVKHHSKCQLDNTNDQPESSQQTSKHDHRKNHRFTKELFSEQKSEHEEGEGTTMVEQSSFSGGQDQNKKSGTVYVCTSCQHQFKTPVEFRIHLNVTDSCKSFYLHPKNTCPVKLNYCPYCCISMPSHCKLVNHQCHGITMVKKCEVCSNIFSTTSALKIHQRMSNCRSSIFKNKNVEASKAQTTVSFNTEAVSREEVARDNSSPPSHANKKVYDQERHECLVCSVVFGQVQELLDHSHTHIEESEYKCRECGMSFNRYNGLVSHMIWHKRKLKLLNEKPNDSSFFEKKKSSTLPHAVSNKINSCSESTKPVAVKREVTMKFDDSLFSCAACGQQFSTLRGRDDHLESSAGCKGLNSSHFGSNTESKVVKDSVKLARQMQMGSKSKKVVPIFFKCTLCSRILLKDSFRKHTKSHIKQFSLALRKESKLPLNAPYKVTCPICNKDFHSRKGGLEHLARHRPSDIMQQTKTAQKPSLPKSVNNYVVKRKVAKRKYKFSCNHCSKKFLNIPAFRFHLKRAHKQLDNDDWSRHLNNLEIPLGVAEGDEGGESFTKHNDQEKTSSNALSRPKKPERVSCELCNSTLRRSCLPRHMHNIHGLPRSLFYVRQKSSVGLNLKEEIGSTRAPDSDKSFINRLPSGSDGHVSGNPRIEVDNGGLDIMSSHSDGLPGDGDFSKECRICSKSFSSRRLFWQHQFKHIKPCSIGVIKLEDVLTEVASDSDDIGKESSSDFDDAAMEVEGYEMELNDEDLTLDWKPF